MESTLTPLILGGAQAEERAMDEVELRLQLERVHADCFGWAMACCNRDGDDAEEVLQTVYLSVLDGHARYDARSSFRTWLFGVIRRTAKSERRKAWVRRGREAGGGRGEASGFAHEAVAPPDGELERESRRDGLERALTRLSARQREVLQLVFYHDLTLEEAAGVMRVSVGSARTHYARGKANLAELLGDAKEL
jgi:RNA polymerase sigma factor (sigma-70 family)